MTTLNTILEHVCSGGGHLRVTFTVDGTVTRTAHITASDIREPITNEELDTFGKLWLKLYSRGKTNNQARTGLQVGFGVTI